MIGSYRLGAREKVHFNFADPPAAEFDIASTNTIVLLDWFASPNLGDQCAGHRLGRALREDPGFGGSRVGTIPDRIDVGNFVSSVRGLTVTQPFSARPLSRTTEGTRCLGTPRNRSNAISELSSRETILRAASILTTRLDGWNLMLRSAKAATKAFEVSGEGGTGVESGSTKLISHSPLTPRLSR